MGPNHNFALGNGSFHGFAIALNDIDVEEWSADYQSYPENSSYWNSSLGSTQYSPYLHGDDLYRAFDLTVLAAYYNKQMSSRYDILPVEAALDYSGAGLQYDVSAFPGQVTASKMGPWIAPTVFKYKMLRASISNDKLNTEVIDLINTRIARLRGTKFFQNSADLYWTVSTSETDPSRAYAFGLNGPSTQAKIVANLLFRPFMVF